MSAVWIAKVLQTGLLIWLVLLMLLVVARMLRGNISARGMLAGDASRVGDEIQPERAVAMLVYPLILLLLTLSALGFDANALPPGVRPSFPEIPENLVTLLTGTSGVYIAGKVFRASR